MPHGKVAIITGAGSGIGKHAAILLAGAGYRVVLVGRTEAKLQATAALIGQAADADDTYVLAADIAAPHTAARLVGQTLDRFGGVDALVNVAGDATLQPIEQISEANWRQCIDTNLSAIVLLTAAVWPTFKKQGSGVIVNVSSMASIDPFPGFSIYAAAKVGVNMFTRCSGDEGDGVGIKAVCIAPGAVETPMLRGLFSQEQFPSDKTLDPGDVANLIYACVIGKHAFDNGQTITMPSP